MKCLFNNYYYYSVCRTCDGGELEQVSVQVDVHPGAMVGQGDAGAVPPDRQVLVEAEDQPSQSNLDGLSPGEGTSPPGVVFHQNLGDGRGGTNTSRKDKMLSVNKAEQRCLA